LESKLKIKYKKLTDRIHSYGSAAVAFSGGLDSTLLAYAAAEALGPDNILCVTARAASFPERELQEAAAFCKAQGIRHEIINFDELGINGFAANPPNRCYLCKYELFSKIKMIADKSGIITVFEGSNADDENDYRPGMKAIAELGVKSPLLEAGLVKDDIREILKALGLPGWDKQPFACLASRFVYGEEITREKLGMVGKAEQFLIDKGFKSVRVRIHGKESLIARIEVPAKDIAELTKEPIRGETAAFFKELGFVYTSLDLSGYRTGSMNEALKDKYLMMEK